MLKGVQGRGLTPLVELHSLTEVEGLQVVSSASTVMVGWASSLPE